MAKRKDFVSEGLVTLRHKYVAEGLDARKGDDDISGIYSDPDLDKNLSIQEQKIQTYHQMKDDLNIRLQQQVATLKTEIELEQQSLKNYEEAHKRFDEVVEKFTDLPESTELEEKSDALTRLEQLRVEFFGTKSACKRVLEKSPVHNVPVANSPQISLLPELNSLNQLQMLKMGLCFAFPLIVAIVIGCIIIASVIILTFGK
ncbi:MAG: hypothetical protein KOO69_07960 [Victivallales bacterium]|nr:hypothetical protein [Victivallales bacterium]